MADLHGNYRSLINPVLSKYREIGNALFLKQIVVLYRPIIKTRDPL